MLCGIGQNWKFERMTCIAVTYIIMLYGSVWRKEHLQRNRCWEVVENRRRSGTVSAWRTWEPLAVATDRGRAEIRWRVGHSCTVGLAIRILENPPS